MGISLGWRHLGNSRCRKDILIFPFLPEKKEIKTPIGKMASLYQKKRNILQPGVKAETFVCKQTLLK